MSTEAQVLGLAGTFQAVRLVLDVARDGKADPAASAASLASVLRLDADTAADVFGGAANLKLGLDVLLAELDGTQRDPALARTVATVLHLERKLARRPVLREKLGDGLRAAQRSAEAFGPAHENVVEQLAGLYTGTLSTMRPRIIVQGNGLYLSQPRYVAQIRALLLAAVRAAVLWRQSGGNGWKLLFARHRIVAIARVLRQTVAADRGNDADA